MSEACCHPDPHRHDEVGTCHDCAVKEGEIHEYGCDMERCPFCGGQLITCDCIYKHFYPNFNPKSRNSGLPEDVYEEGPPQSVADAWLKLLEQKGRVPYIRWPNICGRCGKLWPEMFFVSDEEWNRYVQIDQREQLLCRPCYDKIKKLIDGRQK